MNFVVNGGGTPQSAIKMAPPVTKPIENSDQTIENQEGEIEKPFIDFIRAEEEVVSNSIGEPVPEECSCFENEKNKENGGPVFIGIFHFRFSGNSSPSVSKISDLSPLQGNFKTDNPLNSRMQEETPLNGIFSKIKRLFDRFFDDLMDKNGSDPSWLSSTGFSPDEIQLIDFQKGFIHSPLGHNAKLGLNRLPLFLQIQNYLQESIGEEPFIKMVKEDKEVPTLSLLGENIHARLNSLDPYQSKPVPPAQKVFQNFDVDSFMARHTNFADQTKAAFNSPGGLLPPAPPVFFA